MDDVKTCARINCVFAMDGNYCQHLCVTMVSLLENDTSDNLAIYIVHSNVSDANLALLASVLKDYPGLPVTYHAFDATTYSHFRVDNHITLATYFRLFLANILPASVTRLIYLDSDLVVLSDLKGLWDVALDNNLIAAVPDPFMQDNSRLNLPEHYRYFNAGVLLIDLAGWRANKLTEVFTSYVEKASTVLRFHDQDTLNVVLQDRVKYLDFSWNFQARFKPRDVERFGLTYENFLAIRKAPKIVHFTTQEKPWFYKPDIAFEDRYKYYLRKTPWKNYVPPDKTFLNFLARRIKRNLPWVANVLRGKSSRAIDE